MNYKDDLINYRRSKARETLNDAKILIESKSYSSAVNRIYYSLFYETSALLLTKDFSSAKHSGIRALFNEHFIKTGAISLESGRFYTVMFEFRQKSDYGDFISFEEEKVIEWYSMAELFIAEIENFLKGHKSQ